MNRPVDSTTMSTSSSRHGKLGWVLLGEDPNLAAIDDQTVTFGLDAARVWAIGGVVLEQERIQLRTDEVVDRHDIETR